MMTMEQITYKEARAAVKDKGVLTFDPEDEFFALKVDGKVITIMSLARIHGKLKTRANYTLPACRKQGMFSWLLNDVLQTVREDVYADCLETSVRIYQRQGFTEYKPPRQFKLFKVWYMVRRFRKPEKAAQPTT